MYKNLQVFFFALMCLVYSAQGQNTIDNPFFERVPYSGAFGLTDWTAGWANFDPQNTVYPATNVTVNAGDITTNTVWSASDSPVNGAASFTDSYLQDPFFEPVTFVGAFGPVDWTAGWSNFNPQNTVYPVTNVTINAGDITTNTTWTSNNVYKLNGFVYVKSGATLTIQAGTIIRGDKNNKGALIIERGGKINAVGTATNPIVFTSNLAAGSRDYGDWGGIIICGRAKNNQGNDVLMEGGVNAYYGGQDDNDNSGTMKYVRIEYSGVAFSPNNEINGLTMGSVGRGTTLSHIQVSYCGDDSFEWFGGTVNAKYLIALASWDDCFDTDFGYTGKVQFAVSLRDPNAADVSSSNAFESDNDATGSNNNPRTRPIFSNVSVFGPKATPGTSIHSDYRRAMHLRRNTETSIFNSIFAGFPTGLFIDGTNTQANATNNVMRIKNTYLSGMQNNFNSTFEQTYFNDATRNNQTFGTYGNHSALLITDPFNLTNPNFLPTKKVYLLNGWVYVKNNATLTIQPGTIIRGDKTNKGSIIVERGSKLIAEGNVNEPIVFTSNQPVGSRAPGDWGGIILCGNATINVPGGTATIEGGVGSIYGGGATPNDADNSGILKYVRSEYSGVAYSPNNEINGITMGGVGSGTTIEYVQVSYNGDDAFEWFGGTVNAKYLIAYANWDDDFDTDQGFSGMVQFAVSLRHPDYADVSSSNSFESDNDATGSANAPLTKPIFSNVSIFGPKATASTSIHSDYKRAMHLRRNTRCSIYNALFMGFPTGLFIDGSNTQAGATANELQIENSFMSGMGTNFASAFENTYWSTASRNNTAPYTNNTQMMIADPFNLTSPNFLPMNGSPVLNGSRWVKTINGKIEYANTALTDLNNVTVTCKNASGKIIGTAMTNTTGDYTIHAVDGVFDLTVECNKAWGGLSIADVVRLRQGIANPASLTAIQAKAGDVNPSAGISIADVVVMRQRLAGQPTPNWIAPDYVFETATVTIPPSAGPTTKNILGLCSGDVNGSFTPAAK